MCAEIENSMLSSKRLIEYTKLETEDKIEKQCDAELDKRMWPSQGKIEFEDVTVREFEEQDKPNLDNLSFKVQAGMTVGIVGKSGSGKSSILKTLFRLLEVDSGKVSIDGVDINTTGLHILRKAIAYIP